MNIEIATIAFILGERARLVKMFVCFNAVALQMLQIPGFGNHVGGSINGGKKTMYSVYIYIYDTVYI